MDLGLTGKRALTSGSTRGIGRAIAETLLAEGASVAICARSAADVSAALKELSELSEPGRVVGNAVEASDRSSLEAWVRDAAEQLGGIDVYVHNTSGRPQKVLNDWSKNFEIDLVALVGGVAAAKTVAHHPTGRIGITQDVANAVAFLASPAVAHVNSANLTVDGGFLKSANC